MPPRLTMPWPSIYSALKISGHTNSKITETMIETMPVTMATQRLPLKNASQSGSLVFLNLL